MPKPSFDHNIFEYGGYDLELYFVKEVVGLDSLHYGYFEPGDALTMDALRRAQSRYTETLADLLPADVHRVLDVGCGVGDVARAMAGRGKTVIALSPDRNHGRYLEGSHPRISFVNRRFEDHGHADPVDLVLMSESQNYFETEAGLSQCRKHLRPGGYLLVSGMFVKEPCEEFKDIVNAEAPYFAAAARQGFELLERRDITDQVVPTLQFALQALEQFIEPVPRMLGHYIRARSPVKHWLLKTFFGRQVRDYQKTLDYYKTRMDVDLFKRRVRYLRVLFRHNAAGVAAPAAMTAAAAV